MPDKALVKKRFSRSLKTYSGDAEIQRIMAEKLTAMIVRRRTCFSRVLEIGAGTGLLTALLDEKISWEHRIVNDLAEDCAAFHLARRNTFFLPGDAETLEWGDEPFDLICSNAAFQWFGDLPAFLKKVKSSMNPEGLLAFTTFGPENLAEIRALTGQSLRYFPLDPLKNELHSCGFDVLDSYEDVLIRYFDDPLDLLKMMRRTGVTASANRTWWTPRRLAEFRHAYRERFGTPEHRVKATWHPVFILAQNNEGDPS